MCPCDWVHRIPWSENCPSWESTNPPWLPCAESPESYLFQTYMHWMTTQSVFKSSRFGGGGGERRFILELTITRHREKYHWAWHPQSREGICPICCPAVNKMPFLGDSRILVLHHISRTSTFMIFTWVLCCVARRVSVLYQFVGSTFSIVNKLARGGWPISSMLAIPFCLSRNSKGGSVGIGVAVVVSCWRRSGRNWWMVAIKLCVFKLDIYWVY